MRLLYIVFFFVFLMSSIFFDWLLVSKPEAYEAAGSEEVFESVVNVLLSVLPVSEVNCHVLDNFNVFL